MWKKERRVVVFQLGKPMPEEEMVTVAETITTEEPWWRMLMQLAHNGIVQCNARALDPKLSDGETKYNLGGEDALGEFVARLQGMIIEARKRRK